MMTYFYKHKDGSMYIRVNQVAEMLEHYMDETQDKTALDLLGSIYQTLVESAEEASMLVDKNIRRHRAKVRKAKK